MAKERIGGRKIMTLILVFIGGTVFGFIFCSILTAGKFDDLATENEYLRRKMSENNDWGY